MQPLVFAFPVPYCSYLFLSDLPEDAPSSILLSIIYWLLHFTADSFSRDPRLGQHKGRLVKSLLGTLSKSVGLGDGHSGETDPGVCESLGGEGSECRLPDLNKSKTSDRRRRTRRAATWWSRNTSCKAPFSPKLQRQSVALIYPDTNPRKGMETRQKSER